MVDVMDGGESVGPLYEPRGSLWKQLRAVRDMARLPRYWASQHRLPKGTANVLVLPGFMTSDRSTWVLRRSLEALGHRVHGWGLGRNQGDVRSLLPLICERAQKLSDNGPVHLVGWSLGGYLAREVARERPEHVFQVITLASPVVGGPKYTSAARYYRSKGVDLDAIEQEVAQRDRDVPLAVPVTALYSPSDGVVAPAACIDRVNSHVEHIEVDCSHAGFGFSPDVYRVLAERLADPTPRNANTGKA